MLAWFATNKDALIAVAALVSPIVAVIGGLIAAAVSYRAVVTGPHIQREISRDTLRTSNKFIARRILVQVTRARASTGTWGMCKHLTHKGFRQFVAGADLNCPLLSPTMVRGGLW